MPTACFCRVYSLPNLWHPAADHRHDGGQYWYIVTRIRVSLAASLHEQRDLAVGTALGSNIINILLILGLAALVRPLPSILMFYAVNYP